MSDDTAYGALISSIYFFTNQALLVCLTVYVYLTGEHKNCKEFFKTVWERKWIYGEVTAHLYDTASDIGVLVEWYILAYDGNEYSINMMAMFWASIAFQFLYRFLLCGFTVVRFGYSPEDDDTESCGGCMAGICWAWTDMQIIKTVYISIKHGETEPNARQNSIGIIEAIAESAPQIILQCIFLARSYSDPILSETDSSVMVIISLVASIFSISSKYVELDSSSVVEGAKELGFKLKQWPCVNFMYVLRILWRFNFLLSRMFLLVSIWLVLGGPVFAIFLSVSTCIWCCCLCRLTDTGDCYGSGNYYVCCVACIANPITTDFKVNCYHFFEMITWMIIISILGFTNDLELYDDNCGELCADELDRIATGNPYAEGFIIIAWIALVIDFVLFYILYHLHQFEDNNLDEIFQVFIDGQTYSPGKTKVKQQQQEQGPDEIANHIELQVDQQAITR